ncbi:MAG: NAD-dependent epimerase/dehydratase family protein [Granulosicoccus sp.]
MKRLLITGAAGHLGGIARQGLGHLADTLRLSDISTIEKAQDNEEIVPCDLTGKDAVQSLVSGCDGIVHMGGCRNENTWLRVREANIDGLFNLYEAARKNSKPRIVFASSNHAIGCYRQNERLDARSATRPDGLYGVSKVFGEALASMYFDKFGIETASVRIGSCLDEPKNHRMLSTWLSPSDFLYLIECIFRVPVLGCPIIYGASNNDASWWNNDAVAYLGWQPKDNAEAFRKKLDASLPPQKPTDPDAMYQGAKNVIDDIVEVPW